MKPSTALKMATELENRIERLISPLNEKLQNLLNDDCAHFVYQQGDGWCIAYRGGLDNAAVGMLDIDSILKICDADDALRAIDVAGI